MADATSPTHATDPTRSDIWFEDGNVVIQAEGKQFKVHRGVLAANSSIFKDMFAMPQPLAEGEKTVEGCPVIHVSDSAADIAIVLRALFLRGHVATRQALSITIIAAFLRLGTKYDIELLRAEALNRLHYEYPSTLEEYDKINKWSMINGRWGDGTHFAVVNLAREQGLLSVLPLSLYLSCCYPYSTSEIATGIPSDDGTTSRMLPDDLIRCLGAWNSIGIKQSTMTLAWINLPIYPNCKNSTQCTKLRVKVMKRVFYPFVEFFGLHTWREFETCWVYPEENLDMCDSCYAVAERLHEDGRSKFWETLPGIFGLPEWEELRKEREELK
ncbi:hypothetical protein FIBSPDRAFT_275953 [Athelia psychrophila]|uniref:BTB domain-containing protein n=1 Tax=Athelia psychrophila TaxID=1759441 RepID=A0A166REC8_9AGAM|nr:hypothetical protein FIBSPDRAFT_275953 [Fibularhizoctonia sp. CBS 109695]